jgi:hypothetical protein
MFGRICAVSALLTGSGLADAWEGLQSRFAASCKPAGVRADALAPLLAAHMVFTDNDIREMAWRSLGWWTPSAQPHRPAESSCLASNTSIVLESRCRVQSAPPRERVPLLPGPRTSSQKRRKPKRKRRRAHCQLREVAQEG